MRKIIWSILVTLDGFIDHTAMIADQELHRYATAELNRAVAVSMALGTEAGLEIVDELTLYSKTEIE